MTTSKCITITDQVHERMFGIKKSTLDLPKLSQSYKYAAITNQVHERMFGINGIKKSTLDLPKSPATHRASDFVHDPYAAKTEVRGGTLSPLFEHDSMGHVIGVAKERDSMGHVTGRALQRDTMGQPVYSGSYGLNRDPVRSVSDVRASVSIAPAVSIAPDPFPMPKI